MRSGKFFGLVLIILAVTVHFFASNAICGMDQDGDVGTNLPGLGSTSYRPGATNPVNNPARFYLMRDDILCTLFGKPSQNTLTKNWDKPTNRQLSAWANDTSAVLSEPDYGNGLNKNVISPTAMAMGRINGPEKDDVVGAFYYIDGKKVKPYVFLWITPS